MRTKILFIALSPLFLAACSNYPQPNVNPSPSSNPEQQQSTGTVSSNESGDVANQDVSSFILTGYAKAIATKEGTDSLDIQEIGFYTGDEADKYFAEKNPEACEGMKKEDNTDKCYALDGYYIVASDKTVSYPVSQDVKVFLVNQNAGEGEDITIPVEKQYSDLKALIEKMSQNDIHLPFYFGIKDNKIVEIREQFIP